MAKMKAAVVTRAGSDFEIQERQIPQPGRGRRGSACMPAGLSQRSLFDILHAINGVDSYGAMAVSHGRFGAFLLHRSASLRRISTGFTLGLSGPSC
jgi:hypothetical protein